MSHRQINKILVTGGAGFMGSCFVRYLLQKVEGIEKVVIYDLLTYAGNLDNLQEVARDPRHHFVYGDICNGALVEEILRVHNIDTIVHFAAESHVDRSIADPKLFYRTNVEGTISLLEVVRCFPHIHFHHISTDEVYGSLDAGQFTENSPYRPNSPYAASKAAADHFVRSYVNTYGLSVTLSHASNNFGPCQYREKFIPRMISHCLAKEVLPVYGQGINVRDWLYVEDHAEAVWLILQKGKSKENYHIGGGIELNNIDLLNLLIEKVSKRQGENPKTYFDLITFVDDRPGHDFRYALCTKKLETEIGWKPKHTFEEGIDKTVEWYAQRIPKKVQKLGICQSLPASLRTKGAGPIRMDRADGEDRTDREASKGKNQFLNFLGDIKIVCVIPARMQSSRFPRKMVAPLGGKPLIQWAWEGAMKVSVFDKVVVAVDGKELYDVVTGFGGEALLTSPDCASGTDRLIELQQTEKVEGDIWINWQGDEPFLTEETIATLLQTCDDPSGEIWTLKRKIVGEEEIESPHVVKVVCDAKGRALYFSRSCIPSDKKNLYSHVGIYAYTSRALRTISDFSPAPLEKQERLEQLRYLYHRMQIEVHETSQEIFGIDTEEELAIAQKMCYHHSSR